MIESLKLGTSFAQVTSRFVTLILVTFLYMGRVDVPMLAPGVGYIGNLIFSDAGAKAFKIDMLTHEAVSIGGPQSQQYVAYSTRTQDHFTNYQTTRES